jgi:hypothetical protein
MTKQEAITAMQRGEKVTHKYFSHDEWITINDYCQIEDESGYRHEQDSFWLDRGEQFDVGWELFEAPSVGENAVLPLVSTSTDNEEPIDIYVPKGTKVKYTGRGGYDHHKKHANKHLKVDEIYTIDYTNVDGWHTDVYLKEIPNEAFNSVHFINAK